MRKVWYVVAAGVALAVSLTLAASVSAQSKHSALKRPKIYVFLGTYGGSAATKVSGSTADVTAAGAGTASYIGPGKITGVGKADASSPPCVPFLGTGQMTGKNGTVNFKVTPNSTGCGDEGGHTFAISGKATVTSATGKLKGATGPLKFSGFYDRDKGNFSAKFTGVLKG